MEFSRMGDHTIKCIISEEEIEDLGYTMDEIMSNGERTQEFMNHIFDLAEQNLEEKFEMGVKTVRADFLPNHTLVLTFSEHQGSQMMEHLKDIVSGFLDSIPQDKWEELKKESMESIGAVESPKAGEDGKAGDEEGDEESEVVAIFRFTDMDVLIRFAALVTLPELAKDSLYKYENHYYLVMTLTDCMEKEVLRLSVLTDEYASEVMVGPERAAFLKEHAQCMLKERAVEQLKMLA